MSILSFAPQMAAIIDTTHAVLTTALYQRNYNQLINSGFFWHTKRARILI